MNDFQYICKDLETGLEVWARLTNYLDTVQYEYRKDGVRFGQLNVVSFSEIQLKSVMYQKLLDCFIEKDSSSFSKWVD